MENEIRCAIELRETEGKPARLVGVLLPFNQRAADRAELFESGSVSWPESGLTLRRQHNRSQPILNFLPVEVAGRLTVDAALPDDGRRVTLRQRFAAGFSRACLSSSGLCVKTSWAASVESPRPC